MLLVRKMQGSSCQSKSKAYCVSYSNGDAERASKRAAWTKGNAWRQVTIHVCSSLQLSAHKVAISWPNWQQHVTTTIQSTTTKTISNDETHATPTHNNEHRETTEHISAKSQHTLCHGPSPHCTLCILGTTMALWSKAEIKKYTFWWEKNIFEAIFPMLF